MNRNERALRFSMRRWAIGRSLLAGLCASGSISVAQAAEPSDPPVAPPPINVDYLQYGVSFVADVVLNPGPVCPADAKVPCILGSGGGLTARAGYRSPGPWYVGGAYGFSKLETSGLMRLGVLQHLGGEMRYMVTLGERTEPYFAAGLSALAFGNEWGIETFGLSTHAGLGFEIQLSRTTIVGMSLAYRPTLLFGWTDRASERRPTGVAHFLGLDIVMEAREPLRTH